MYLELIYELFGVYKYWRWTITLVFFRLGEELEVSIINSHTREYLNLEDLKESILYEGGVYEKKLSICFKKTNKLKSNPI